MANTTYELRQPAPNTDLNITTDQEERDLSMECLNNSISQKPKEFPSLAAECAFICTCSMGQLMFAMHLSNAFINQLTLVEALGIGGAATPWLIGSFLVANGVSVVISGSLADLISPKWMVLISFTWITAWNLIGFFSVTPSRMVLFFVSRSMSGCAVGTLCSAAMSMLGRVYKPGIRKNRVFAAMGAMIPMGFAVGALQGGAFSSHLQWIFGSTAILSAACVVLAYWCIPHLATDSLGIRQFDVAGAAAGMAGSGLVIFGLTQGAPTHWTPYTYALVIVGIGILALFGFIESRVERPLIDNRLWSTPGFLPLMISYFLGYGGYCGGWQFYAVRFLLTTQGKSPIITACCLIPIGVAGTLASWVVGRLLHVVPGHIILLSSMIAFALGPVFFLPQTSDTVYWSMSFPGFVLSTFGPDMSFAATSVFITSSVPKTYQGAAGSLLITAQNLSTAVMAAVGDTIGSKVTQSMSFTMDLSALRAIWWFSFAVCMLGAILCSSFVRIPKSEEKEHLV
ncbi:MFS general substrate transporter [Corynespora cassiicola Philippines]|uniref:MFS general substrate transporter n=1 Tax=Corynespora cassiicola Philippines TaxID=1448308 RepID=A0A2T2NJW2_CORCC|nr:MFS general substrate transporter [Corynespora cassiicola Philippines]